MFQCFHLNFKRSVCSFLGCYLCNKPKKKIIARFIFIIPSGNYCTVFKSLKKKNILLLHVYMYYSTRRLRVACLSLSPSREAINKLLGKVVRAGFPEFGLCGHFIFSRFSLASRRTDKAKEGTIVSYLRVV